LTTSTTRRLLPVLTMLTVGLGVLLWVIVAPEKPERYELASIDARFRARGPRPTSGKVVIVAVDDQALAELGKWPWSRERFATLVDRLAGAGAHSVVFDVLFLDADEAGPAGDAAFAAAARRFGRVYQGAALASPGDSPTQSQVAAMRALKRFAMTDATIEAGRGLDRFSTLNQAQAVAAPIASFAEACKGVGFVDVLASADAVYRHCWPLTVWEGQLYPSLSLAAAADALGVDAADIVVQKGRAIRVGDKCAIPLERDGSMPIDFAGIGRVFPHYSVSDVIQGTGGIPDNALRDRIVLVAVTATAQHDIRPTPFDPVGKGAELQAHALDSILTGHFVRRQTPEMALLMTLAWILVISAFICLLRPAVHIPLSLACIVLHNMAAFWAFSRYGLFLAMVTPTVTMVLGLLAASLVKVLTQEKRQAELVNVLAQFVPPEIVSRLTLDETDSALLGETRVVTIVFSDLHGFTGASSRIGPAQTVALLNRYFELMHEIIFEFGGTLDKFVGDEIMAFFNAPADQIDHARLAVACALQMQRQIESLREEWEFHGVPELNTNIGINTGEAIVGYVGSRSRMQYTVIGEAANVASRLEALSKEVDAQIVIGESTYELARDMIDCRDLGLRELPGMDGPIRAYELLGLRERGPGAGNTIDRGD